ncbi:hypothetical protein BDB00DRAFT_812970 [Zychaea mexicana]|uniref:uncharacterized protein n=1 Tax=Zychaea mexicana TaxID=64656 RepID=UPI0022FE6AEF|nr:uncharacterized protein BDB00DRAFT_812970 [Zychaea mexicana]KAI9495676.1 hypothetical protein BDB00DRAFT_812970 [Zychaea mexicana]
MTLWQLSSSSMLGRVTPTVLFIILFVNVKSKERSFFFLFGDMFFVKIYNGIDIDR